jgi:carbon monoxide dehydrogenase subunit G
VNTRTIQVEARIENDPKSVISYIADPRNRPLYLPLLKSVDDIQSTPGVVGSTWRWTVGLLGMDFEGTGRCTEYEAGSLYRFRTEGGIASTWTYRAEADGDGTRLTAEIEYEVPEKAVNILPTESVLASIRKAEADKAIENLKTVLDR